MTTHQILGLIAILALALIGISLAMALFSKDRKEKQKWNKIRLTDSTWAGMESDVDHLITIIGNRQTENAKTLNQINNYVQILYDCEEAKRNDYRKTIMSLRKNYLSQLSQINHYKTKLNKMMEEKLDYEIEKGYRMQRGV